MLCWQQLLVRPSWGMRRNPFVVQGLLLTAEAGGPPPSGERHARQPPSGRILDDCLTLSAWSTEYVDDNELRCLERRELRCA
ncbi:hypothetical protein M440DRAFT_1030493 [Trichoderma longibrachiatum ATCC 18648]|uniref:Uncharacterized protein n=1 Tax=Trichoderma longibrachiatum ATCC 18648 TaxID=983965 RepID=A0A2T4BZ72_TRILO|nr:hypothetical protein M440DRAFT_1030493 [Trichoderma longibrachiatum ATCC 18648]